MPGHSQSLLLIVFVAILIVGGCKKEECDFHYNKYTIDFSEASRMQNPFLEKDSIIIKTIFGPDTIRLRKDLLGEGTRKSAQRWTCASDSTVSEPYDFYYTEKIVHFKNTVGASVSIAMSLINCPDQHDPGKYSEYFELLIATNFNTPFGDHLRLLRFFTNKRDAESTLLPLGEFHKEITIGSKTYHDVWYNEGDFANHHFEVYYSTEAGLIRYTIDSVPFDVSGTF